jgi:hypothetical protein
MMPGIKKAISSLLLCLFVFSCFAMGIDSFKSPGTIAKYFFINSSTIFIVFIITNLLIRIFLNIRISGFFYQVNNFFILAIASSLSIILTVVDYFRADNFVYSRLLLNYQHLGLLGIGCLLIALINAKGSWLKAHSKALIFLSAPVILFILGIVRLWPYDYFFNLVKEDHFIENSQFLALFISSITSLYLAFKFYKFNKLLSVLYLFAALGLFFVSGDEISWGQRLLGINSPEYIARNNAQEEINVHNLYFFNNIIGFIYMLVGLYGAFSWAIVRKPDKPLRFLTWITPQKELFFFFFAGFLYNLYALLSQVYNLYFIGEWSEVAELMLDLGVLIFLLSVFLKIKNSLKQGVKA